MGLHVVDDREQNRYEARDSDGALAGRAEYQPAGRLLVLTHTEVEPDFEGQGVGGLLARHALDDARERHLQVVPLCPFVDGWIARHPEYADLVYRSRSRVRE